MELVVAPVAELRPRVTHAFEELVGSTIDHGAGFANEPYSFACGVTGGSTAVMFLGALREASIDWSRVAMYWGDERAVAPDHPDSNFGLAERTLLTPLGALAPRTLRMKGEAPNLDAAALEYSALLPPALDLLILGVGDDGHVCSLFPGHPALIANDHARAIAIDNSPKPPPRRLTLTLNYVLLSRHVWVVVLGEQKRPVLQAAVSRRPAATPLDLVVSQARDVTIFTDQKV